MTIPSDMQGCTYNGQEVLTLQVNGQTVWEQQTGIESAAFGDILFYDVKNDCLITRSNDDYDINEMPLTDYEPIGVCVWDKASHAAGKTVFMSVKWMSGDCPETGMAVKSIGSGANRKSTALYYGFYGYDLSQDIPNIRSTGYVDTKAINDKMKELVTDNWWKTTVNKSNYGVGYAPAWEVCWRFSPPGTTPAVKPNGGDWLIPSQYDLQKFVDNFQYIEGILTAISNKAGSTVLDSTAVNGSYKLLTEKDENFHWSIFTNRTIDYCSKQGGQQCRSVYIV